MRFNRHLLPEYGSDNQATGIIENELHESEVVEEKISLSDCFGLWLSFHPFRQKFSGYRNVLINSPDTILPKSDRSLHCQKRL